MLGRQNLNDPQRSSADRVAPASLACVDQFAVAYLVLPLLVFLVGWLEPWVALPLAACTLYALWPAIRPRAAGAAPCAPLTRAQLTAGILAGIAWTVFGGTAHLLFANADWHVRDAVLHDLVSAPWPVGYGELDGRTSVLRAPLGYFLPAALVGKAAGLSAAHFAMAIWTALGASLFLLQVLSLVPARRGAIATVILVLVLFSGLDIVGNLLNGGPRFRSTWSIATHLEWWAVSYQYSSMTTQLFWVPNHALGAWLTVGLLYRQPRNASLDLLLPIMLVAMALWSPLAALGLLPFAAWRLLGRLWRERSLVLLDPRVWAPALLVGLAVTGYLTLDPGGIHSILRPRVSEGLLVDLSRHIQFYVLEAGLIGVLVLRLRPSAEVIVALLILAVLPLVQFGPGNDLVMRASIPSLAVLAIGTSLALLQQTGDAGGMRSKAALGVLLAVGAVTPVAEIARAVLLPNWPINRAATVVGADCGRYPPHYIARLGPGLIGRLLRKPHALPLGPQGPDSCYNPAMVRMVDAGLI